MNKVFDALLKCTKTENYLAFSAKESCLLLDKIYRNPERWTAILHPLGFMVVDLAQLGKKSIYLHIWIKNITEPYLATSKVHRHPGRLASFLLCGSMVNYSVEINCNPSTYTHRIYKILHRGNTDCLMPTEQLVSYRVTSKTHLESEHSYSVVPHSFHYTELGESDVTATILISEKSSTLAPETLGNLQAKTHYISRRKCSPPKIKRAVKSVLDAMTLH